MRSRAALFLLVPVEVLTSGTLTFADTLKKNATYTRATEDHSVVDLG